MTLDLTRRMSFIESMKASNVTRITRSRTLVTYYELRFPLKGERNENNIDFKLVKIIKYMHKC